MSTDRTELESRLLRNPFDLALRLEYAGLLLGAAELEPALEQFRLAAQGSPDEAAPVTGAARSLLALGREDEAVGEYDRARGLDGFEPDDDLESLAARRRRAVAGMRVIDGARPDVVDIDAFRIEREPVRFRDVAGMEALKRILRLQIIEPFLRPGLFKRFKKKAGGGVLLYGPPGCGKTLMARAIATECNAGFISVGISDVLNYWIGESERNLSLLFEKARAERPCVLFFDELDALAYSRSKAVSEHSRTVVNEFLAQLDGFGEDNAGLLVLAATNMPWDIDAAMKRPGRFSRQVFVPPPDADARAEMFRMKLTGVPASAVDAGELARTTEHFSGADIDGVIEEAKEHVLAHIIESGEERVLAHADLEHACESVVPSTLDWLRTARNLVKYAGADKAYRDVERYLKGVRGL